MANELPYFRFTVQAWQNGKIDIERNELKGLFISICGFYWINDCNIALALLKKKYSNDISLIDELIDADILKVNRYENIEISFLNNQYDLLSEKRKLRQAAGSKGGNAKAMLKQKGGYKDKDNIKIKEDNNKDNNNRNFNKKEVNVEFEIFWESYDKKVGDKKKINHKWDALTDDERVLVMQYIPEYKRAQPNKQYRKNPETFLNNKSWNDEIILTHGITKSNNQNNQQTSLGRLAEQSREILRRIADENNQG